MKFSIWLAGLSYMYLAGLFIWALIYVLFGDRWDWLFLINSLALYLFLPLPMLLLFGMLARQPGLLAGGAAALLLWAYLYSWRLTPRFAQAQASGVALTVMTSNLLGHNQHPAEAVAALRESDTDVIGLQELNPTTAAAIAQSLAREYPYQLLDPRAGDSGMGILSRYPIHALDVDLPGVWIGSPQAVLVDVRGTSTLLVNMHAMSPRFATMEWTIRERERQAAVLAEFVSNRPEPAIVLGDFNAGDLSRAYRTLAGVLRDAWHEAGRGLGHTFPGADSPGSSRRIVGGIAAPMWLVRIDFVFHSVHWRAEWARVGIWDGVSDHRPVRARLVLQTASPEQGR